MKLFTCLDKLPSGQSTSLSLATSQVRRLLVSPLNFLEILKGHSLTVRCSHKNNHKALDTITLQRYSSHDYKSQERNMADDWEEDGGSTAVVSA